LLHFSCYHYHHTRTHTFHLHDGVWLFIPCYYARADSPLIQFDITVVVAHVDSPHCYLLFPTPHLGYTPHRFIRFTLPHRWNVSYVAPVTLLFTYLYVACCKSNLGRYDWYSPILYDDMPFRTATFLPALPCLHTHCTRHCRASAHLTLFWSVLLPDVGFLRVFTRSLRALPLPLRWVAERARRAR